MNLASSCYLGTMILSVILISGVISRYYHKVDILKLIVEASMCFFTEYLFLSAILIYFDIFQVKSVLFITFIINSLIFIFNTKKIKASFNNIDFNIKKVVPVLLLVIVMIPFVNEKSQSISVGYDAGIYGLKAISLMQDDSTSVYALREYAIVDNSLKKSVVDLQSKQEGLYEKYRDNNTYEYEYHSLSTWPAFMALSGKMFGLGNIALILSFLYVLSGLCIFYILDNLKIKYYAMYLGMFLFLFLPLSIYLAKNSLSEMLYVTFVLFSILLLTEVNDNLKLMSGLAFGSLGFIHLTTLAYIPMIYGILIILHIISNNKIYFITNLVQCFLFGLSFIYALKTTSVYTTIQLKNMFGNIFSNTQLIICILCTVVILMVINLVIYYLNNKNGKRIIISTFDTLFNKYGVLILRLTILFLSITIVYQGYLLGFTAKYSVGEFGTWKLRENYINKGFYSLKYLNIVSILAATSYICIPIIIYKLFKKEVIWGKVEKLFGFAFVYSMMINLILRVDTPKNYYASRYFYISIIPIVFILIAKLIKSPKSALIVGIVAFISGLPFNMVLINAQEYNGNLSVINDALSIIDDNSVVIVNDNNKNLNSILINNLREINDSLVFSDDIMNAILLENSNEDIYYISEEPLNDIRFDKILDKTYKASGELETTTHLYPLTFQSHNTNMLIYKIINNKMVINFDTGDQNYITGFNGFESYGEDGFAWCSGKSSFILRFHPAKSNVIRVHYNNLPQYVFDKRDRINMAFKIKDTVIFETSFTKDNSRAGYFDLTIPEELIKDELEHRITIESDTWSPKDYGSTDMRKLGIAITKIEVMEE